MGSQMVYLFEEDEYEDRDCRLVTAKTKNGKLHSISYLLALFSF